MHLLILYSFSFPSVQHFKCGLVKGVYVKISKIFCEGLLSLRRLEHVVVECVKES